MKAINALRAAPPPGIHVRAVAADDASTSAAAGAAAGAAPAGAPPPVAVVVPLQAPAPPPAGACAAALAWLRAYARRLRGTGLLRASPPARLRDVAVASLGSFVGMLALTAFDEAPVPARPAAASGAVWPQGYVASFGATAALVFAAPAAPMAQPRNVILGQTLSALLGVGLRVLLVELPAAPQASFAVAALAVAVSIAAMMLTGSLHPAGAGTACIAVTSPIAVSQGWLFIVFPVLTSSVILVAVGVLWNNLWQGFDYPAYYFY